MAASRHRRRAAWPDLPSDLVGIVLGRLPSLADRVRLRAVCRSWQSSAATMLHQSPPQLPWLVFDNGTLLDVSNNTAHRVRLPDPGAICYCAGEYMLFVLRGRDGRCSLMNTFSSDVTPLPELAALLKARGIKSPEIMKVVMISAPRLVVVLLSSGVIAFTSCRPAGEMTNSCQVLESSSGRYMGLICDIALFQGEIHAISRDCGLLAVRLNSNERPRFVRRINGASSLPSDYLNHEIRRYLVESNGKLLVVTRCFTTTSWDHTGRTHKLDLMEADLSHGRWNNVDGLEGQALDLMLCSKSVPAAAAAGGDGARQDHIYFLNEYTNSLLRGGLWDCGAYSMRDGTITPLLLEAPATPLYRGTTRARPAWFFPVQV